jgi:hypothetical protein
MRLSIPLQVVFVRVGRSQFCTNREELVLDLIEHRIQAFRERGTASDSEDRIEFIDRTVGADANVILGYAGPSEKTCGPRISGFGVYLHAGSITKMRESVVNTPVRVS